MDNYDNIESKMTLYSITTKNGSLYFRTKEQLDNYMKSQNITIGFITKVEYMGNILNCIDVIKQTYEDGTYRFVSVASEEGYLFYDFEQSKKDKQPVWLFLPGSLRDIYDAFKANGIILEDDTYEKIDQNYHQKVKKHIKRQFA